MTTTTHALPLITLAECDSFDRVAREDGKFARHDPTGEGVEYALIQPYDLARFCDTVRRLHRADFVDHLNRASATVATWPEWKRKALGHLVAPYAMSSHETAIAREAFVCGWVRREQRDLLRPEVIDTIDAEAAAVFPDVGVTPIVVLVRELVARHAMAGDRTRDGARVVLHDHEMRTLQNWLIVQQEAPRWAVDLFGVARTPSAPLADEANAHA